MESAPGRGRDVDTVCLQSEAAAGGGAGAATGAGASTEVEVDIDELLDMDSDDIRRRHLTVRLRPLATLSRDVPLTYPLHTCTDSITYFTDVTG